MALTLGVDMNGIRIQVVNTLKLLTHIDRPGDRRTGNF